MAVEESIGYGHETKGDYVRIFVNDALQPLKFCGAGEDGVCKLGDFVKSQRYSQNDGLGDFEGCNYAR